MTIQIKIISAIGLGAATLCMVLVPVHAADANEHSFQIKSRVIHFDRDFETDSKDREQSALGLQLNYKSPQFSNLIGFGLSGYVVEEIGSSGSKSEDILTKEANGELDGFGLIGQAYVNVTPTDGLAFKLGRQVHKSMFLSSSGSRAVPNTFRGVSANYIPVKGLTVYGAVYDEWSRRGRDDFEGFATDRSAEGDIEYVGLIGVKYKADKLTVEGEHLISDDYLTKLGLRASYVFDLEASKLKLSGGVFGSYDDGALFVTGAEGGDLDDEDVAGSIAGVTSSDNDGLGAYIDTAWIKGNAELSVAYAKFDGLWIEDNFTGDHGTNPFPTRSAIGPDLTNAGERVVRVKLKYDWKDYAPGMVTSIAAGHGWDAENSANADLGSADEDWRELDVTYKVPQVKGLKLRGIWHDYDADEVGTIDGVKEDETDLRFYVDYAYNF